MSKIEWTEKTWNPTTGCSVISPGCKNCYAEVMTKRLHGMGQEKYAAGFKLTVGLISKMDNTKILYSRSGIKSTAKNPAIRTHGYGSTPSK